MEDVLQIHITRNHPLLTSFERDQGSSKEFSKSGRLACHIGASQTVIGGSIIRDGNPPLNTFNNLWRQRMLTTS